MTFQNSDPPAAASDEAASIQTNALPHALLGWVLVVAGLGGFLVWASLAPLDQGVPVTGTVTVSGNKKAVQHLTGGTVEEILVHEGDEVKAGQVLVRMNGVQARANAEITRTQLVNALATEARLIAERDNRASITFPTEAADQADFPTGSAWSIQRQLFHSRKEAIRSEIGALEQNIAGLQALVSGIEASRSGKQLQLKLLQEQIDGMKDLAADGYMPRNRLLELERQRAQIEATIAEDLGNIGRSMSQIGELRLRVLQVTQDFQKDVRTQLADVQREISALRSRLHSLDYEVQNIEVRAPVGGVISDLAIFTEGGVVAPGFRMMDVVPLGESLLVEGQVPVHLIDSVHPNLPVELIFSAFNQNTTPRVPGLVTKVSPDRLVDQKTGLPYYRVHAEITPSGRHQIAELKVRPGMPVEMFIRTGERTMANYLIRPLKDHLRMAMTEE